MIRYPSVCCPRRRGCLGRDYVRGVTLRGRVMSLDTSEPKVPRTKTALCNNPLTEGLGSRAADCRLAVTGQERSRTTVRGTALFSSRGRGMQVSRDGR